MIAFPMHKGDNIIIYSAELKANKIINSCTDKDFSKFRIFKNEREIFHLGTYQEVINNSIEIRKSLKDASEDGNAKIVINSRESLGVYDKYEFSNINSNTLDEIWNYYINFFQYIKMGNESKKSTFSESNNILRLNEIKKYLENKLTLILLDKSIDKNHKIQLLKESKYEFIWHIIHFFENLKIRFVNLDDYLSVKNLYEHFSNLNLIYTSELNSLINVSLNNEESYDVMKKLYEIGHCHK